MAAQSDQMPSPQQKLVYQAKKSKDNEFGGEVMGEMGQNVGSAG